MIELVVRRGSGIKWWAGWPYTLTAGGYTLPTRAHDELCAWWRADGRLSAPGGFASFAALLDAVDRAVRAAPPPHPFQLTRNDKPVRSYAPTVRAL